MGQDTRRDFIVKSYKEGQTLQQIGDQLGLTRERIRQLLAKQGLNKHHGGVMLRTARRDQAVQELLDKGATRAEAGRALGVSAYSRRVTALTPAQRFPERFWKRVQRSSPEECWPWLGYRRKDGAKYGWLHLPGYRTDYAHRVAWSLANGRDPVLNILHKCDNPPCCNPAHLYEGTQAQNVSDREARKKR